MRRVRSNRISKWFWGIVCGVILFITFMYGPSSKIHHECLVCGKSRVVKKCLGIPCYWWTTSTTTSEWLGNRLPQEHSHIWHAHAGNTRNHWFQSFVSGSGAGPLGWIHGHEQHFGENITSEYVDIFHELLISYGKEEALLFHSENMLPLRLIFSENDPSSPSKEVLLSFIEKSKVNFIAELYSRPELFPPAE